MTLRISRSIAVAATLLALCACSSGPKGRIMDTSEEDVVGSKSAGAETYDRLVSQAVERILQEHSAANTGVGKLKVAILPVENASSEELTDWQEQLYELIDTSINQSDRYRTVSKRFIDAALREARLRPDDLFIPKNRRAFMQVLETQGNPVECLLFPKLTSGTTYGNDVKQRDYLLTLELVDVETGWNDKVAAKLRKEYTH